MSARTGVPAASLTAPPDPRTTNVRRARSRLRRSFTNPERDLSPRSGVAEPIGRGVLDPQAAERPRRVALCGDVILMGRYYYNISTLALGSAYGAINTGINVLEAQFNADGDKVWLTADQMTAAFKRLLLVYNVSEFGQVKTIRELTDNVDPSYPADFEVLSVGGTGANDFIGARYVTGALVECVLF